MSAQVLKHGGHVVKPYWHDVTSVGGCMNRV